MKQILMTTALVAMMPAAVLAQESDATATDPMLQTEQSADADASATIEDGAASADTEMTAEGDATMTTEGTEDATAAAEDDLSEEGSDAMMAAEGEGAELKSDSMEAMDNTGSEMEQDMEQPTLAEAADNVNGTQADMEATDMADAGFGFTGEATANDIIGARLYVIRGEDMAWDQNATYDAVSADWERAGSIQNLVIGEDGKIDGLVAEVGGFLGIGDKFVELEMGQAKLIPLEGGGFDVVTHYTNDELTDMQAFEAASLQ